MSAPVDVTGGAGGITANRDAIAHLAGLHKDAAVALWVETRGVEHELTALGNGLLPGDYGGAGRLDLAGLSSALSALDDAVSGLRRSGEGTGELATKLHWVVQGYPWGKDALGTVLDEVDGLLHGLGGATLLRGVAGVGIVASGPSKDKPNVAGQDPRTVDAVIDLVDLPALSELASGDNDGFGIAIATGSATVATPRGLTDLIAGLSQVDHTGTPGGIDVRILTDAAGHRRVIVDITGTRVWRPGKSNPADLTTNTRAMGGHDTAYSQGVLAAMRQAGVRRGEPVMLVGHSQGGMIAVNTAAVLGRTGEFTVTHVVTAGSPISTTVARLPSSVRVLALENSRDAVPRLDGSPNPDRPTVTTVTGTAGDGSVGDSHSIDSSYRPIAAAAQRDGGRSVRDFLSSAGGYFRAVHVEQHRYRVERR